MTKQKLNTRRGVVAYYTLNDVYPDRVTFMVRFDDEASENEFSVPTSLFAATCPSDLVRLYVTGYEQGRQRGRWEKARKLGSLFSQLQAEASGI